MPESEEDHEDEHKNPSRIVEDRDETHAGNGDEEDGAAPSSKEGIGDMSSIDLSDMKEVKGGDEEADPSGISDGMKHHINIFWNLSQDQSLDEGEEKWVCQTDRSFLNLGGRNQYGKLQANGNGRNAQNKAGQRACDPCIEDGFPG